ncbi:MAG: hypothetical protein MJA84_12780 [Firmicutes bacterium]|nr:hypothetical protein [Bacillota bacterium]
MFKKIKNIKIKSRRHKWPDRELAEALKPLARRVTTRYWLESARLGLLWGLAAATMVMALLRLYPAAPAWTAAVAGLTAVLTVLALRIWQRPDALTVVRVADTLGLNGDAVTAFRLFENKAADPWSRAAAAGGIDAGARLAAGTRAAYPAVPHWRSWRDLALLAVALVVLQALPDPLGAYWAERRAEKQALQAAAREADRVVDEVRELEVAGEDVLPEELKQRLGDLPREVARAADRHDAAAKLERARWELDGVRAVVDPSARRDIKRLEETWGRLGGEEWRNMAEALGSGDESDIHKAVENLSEQMKDAGEEERLETAAVMFASAGLVENPELRRALRDTAGAVLSGGRSPGPPGSGGNQGPGSRNPDAANSLAGALSGAAATASAGGALGGASATLSNLARDLSGAGSGGGAQMAGNNVGDNPAGSAGAAPGGASSGNAHSPGGT